MSAMVAQLNGLIGEGPAASLDAYLLRVSQIPVLGKDEEIALATRFRSENDLEAARQLVVSNLRFVVHVARGYMGYKLPMGDLIQEGNLGLMKAVKRFDPSVGVRLASFAVHWIRAEIHAYVIRNWRLVKVATTKAQRKLFFNLRRMKKSLSWLSEQKTQAVARDLNVDASDVREMEQRLAAQDVSFDPTLKDDEEEGYFPAMYLSANKSDPALELEREEWEEDTTVRLKQGLEKLDPRSRNILERRWMTNQKATLHELAQEYGVSLERVRQIENNAIRRLKGMVAAG